MAEISFTADQFVFIASQLIELYKENPSSFKLTDPPRHTVEVSANKTIEISFQGSFMGMGNTFVEIDGKKGRVEIPNLFFSPIRFIKLFIARSALWGIAEDLLKELSMSESDRLLHAAFPAMFDKSVK